MEVGRIFKKTFCASLLIKTYRMSLISAGSISLDSTFNELNKKIGFLGDML
jgi:hypothetical protein